MRVLNAAAGSLISALLWPFRDWPLAGLGVVSLLAAAALIAVFRLTANHQGLEAAKRQMIASLFEIRLFNDDLRAIARAQLDLLRHYASYVRGAMAPVLWTLVPLALLIGHLHAHYGYDGLTPGRSALVTARLTNGAAQAQASIRPRLALHAPDGLRVETPFVWVPARREAVWRVRAEREGTYDLRIALDALDAADGVDTLDATNRAATKRVIVSSAVAARSPVRPADTFAGQWWHPAEPPLPGDSPYEAIEIAYPERGVALLGFELHWLVVFCLLSFMFAVVFQAIGGARARPAARRARPRG